MSIRVKMPDGSIAEFPDGMTPEEIERAIHGVSQSAQTSAPSGAPTAMHTLGDALMGALKGGGETAFYLGKMLHKIPGVSEAVDAAFSLPKGTSQASFSDQSQVLQDLQASSTAQKVGKGVERIAETIAPAGVIGRAGEALAAAPAVANAFKGAATAAKIGVNALGGGFMSAAQGGDPVTGAVLSGAATGAGDAAKALSAKLKDQAETKIMQALGATKERYKAIADKITPEILQRGLTGSREAIQQRAAAMKSEVGDQIDTAIQAFNRTHDSSAVLAALEQAKAPYLLNVNGKTVVLDSRPIGQLDKLKQTLTQLGPQPTTEQLVAVRRAWDQVASQAGGYAQRAAGAIGMPLKEQSEAWAKREGANAIRSLLAQDVPELAKINKEYSFWKNLDDVLTQTLQRTAPQKPGLAVEVAKAGGQAAGAAIGVSGGPAASALGSVLGRQLSGMVEKAITSPSWKMVDAQLRNKLADAITAGSRGQVLSTLSRIASVQGSKLPQLLASTVAGQ